MEFVSKAASKGAALEWIYSQTGVRQCETIAIGDGENDLSMIRYAGLSVAMGNACEEVLHAADVITLRNDQNGVKAILEKYF